MGSGQTLTKKEIKNIIKVVIKVLIKKRNVTEMN